MKSLKHHTGLIVGPSRKQAIHEAKSWEHSHDVGVIKLKGGSWATQIGKKR